MTALNTKLLSLFCSTYSVSGKHKLSAYCNIQFSDPIRPTYDRYFYRALTASKTTQIRCIYILVTLQFDFISSSKRF